MSGEFNIQITESEEKLMQLENSVNILVNKYLRRAEMERAKFIDDSYDSDISGAWSSKKLDEARQNYELYLAIAQDIASLLR